jgi:hypothetical protein
MLEEITAGCFFSLDWLWKSKREIHHLREGKLFEMVESYTVFVLWMISENRDAFSLFLSLFLLRPEFLYANILRIFIINRSKCKPFYSSYRSCKRSVLLKLTRISIMRSFPSTQRKWPTQEWRIIMRWELQVQLLPSQIMRCCKWEYFYINQKGKIKWWTEENICKERSSFVNLSILVFALSYWGEPWESSS